MPADLELGFMAYGHREKGNCDDIELIVPPAAGTANAITTAADNLKFLGKTPLTAAVKQAAEALKYTEDKATVILITDGLETCNADPCALGKELEAVGRRFHRPCRRLRADGGGGQAGRLPRRQHRRQIHPGRRRRRAGGGAGRDRSSHPRLRRHRNPLRRPSRNKPEFNFLPTVVLAEGGDPIKDGNAWVIYKANADGTPRRQHHHRIQ